MKNATGYLLAVLIVIGGLFLLASIYTVQETEQVIITQFGKPVGQAVTNAGLHLKAPFIQEVNRIEKRFLGWDGQPNEMPTKDKTYILVDTFARWRVSDAKQYFLRLRDERSALSRLDDILGSETRNAIAKHELIEVVRTTTNREPATSEILSDALGNVGILVPISRGRTRLEEDIFRQAAPKLDEFGIKLLDIRFKRINYNETVRQRIYERMISERQQIADRFRSEGEGEAAKITGKKERDLQEIESEAYRKVQEIQGQADAQATEIYAQAYDQSPESRAFYEFIKPMETYQDILDRDTMLILSTDSDIFQFLKKSEPGQE